jgi:hypothetical protein
MVAPGRPASTILSAISSVMSLVIAAQGRLHARNHDVVQRVAADNTFLKRGDNVGAIHQRLDPDTTQGAAVDLFDDDVLRHVHQTAGEVPGVGGLERRIGQDPYAHRATR